MSNPEEIKPCPNPVCEATCTTDAIFFNTSDEMHYVECTKCSALGPEGKTELDAIRLHNDLPRREEIYAELAEIHDDAVAIWGELTRPQDRLAMKILIAEIKELAVKYKPEDGG